MVHHLRFHGRGGEGVKLAGRITSRAAFLAGFTVQDSPLYGAERRGAPVVAFTRVSRGPILERGYIDAPDVVVLMDASLLLQPAAAVLDGVGAETLVMIDSPHPPEVLREQHRIAGTVMTLDVSAIALEVLGERLLSAPVVGFVARAVGLARWDLVAEAVRIELAEVGAGATLIERNVTATQRAYDAARALGMPRRAPSAVRPATTPFVVPHLTAMVAAPAITAAATSALRTMDGWRVYRPAIDLERCTRCCICFALCPEGAIHLDERTYPVVDYTHCKGCLVCVTECPPHAISEVREVAA